MASFPAVTSVRSLDVLFPKWNIPEAQERGFISPYVDATVPSMGFYDEARKIAQQKLQDQATGAETLGERIDRLFPQFKERRERVRSNCIEKVLKWFDEIGMLPHPELEVEWVVSSGRPYSDADYETSESFVRIGWVFEGYEYWARCGYDHPEWGPAIKIRLGHRWFDANTIEEIGRAFLIYEEMGF